jgi:hypothetical protein
MIEVEPKTRDIPIWLTGVVLILCVVGGAWLVRWYTRDPGTQAVEVPLEDPATVAAAAKFRGPLAGYSPVGGGRAQRDGTGDGVRATGNSGNAWIVRAGEATMYVSLLKKGDYELNPSFIKQALTPEQAQVLMMRRRLMIDAAMRAQIQLTADQLDALRKVEDFKGMVIDTPDRLKLTNLFKAWRAAPNDASEKPLVAALAEIAKRAAEPTKAFDAARVERVRKILTPEQVKRFNDGPAAPAQNGAPAAPPPAVKPVVQSPAGGAPGKPG